MSGEHPPSPIDLARESQLVLAGVCVHPATLQVIGDARREVLEPRVMQVLVALARSAGEVVSRDTLNALCWGGRIVGDDALTRCIVRLRRVADAFGGFEIETVPRVGYRLSELVRAPTDQQAAQVSPSNHLPLPGKLAVALMPFADRSGDSDGDAIAQGVVEEIAAALSRFRALGVISAATTSSLRHGHATPQQIARELDVRYVLEGSVRKGAGRVRIVVSLISGDNGAQLWSERFEDEIEEVFLLQDRVALAVPAAILPLMHTAETRRTAKRPEDKKASYDHYLRVIPLLRTFQLPDLLQAINLLERVVALDPDFALGYAVSALAHGIAALPSPPAERDSHVAQARQMARRALAMAEEDANVLAFSAAGLTLVGEDTELVRRLGDRALSLNPGSFHMWYQSGTILVMCGDADQGLERIEKAMQLDPLSSHRDLMLSWLGVARFEQGRYAEALPALRESALLRPAIPHTLPVMAASQAYLGKLIAARETLLRAPAAPSVETLSEILFRDPEHRARFLAGVALAR